MLSCCSPGTCCTELRLLAAGSVKGRCSASPLTGQVSQTCTASRPLFTPTSANIPTAMDPLRPLVWSCEEATFSARQGTAASSAKVRSSKSEQTGQASRTYTALQRSAVTVPFPGRLCFPSAAPSLEQRAAGGTWGRGTAFSYSFAPGPILTISVSGTNAVITWPVASSGYLLQSAPDVRGPFTNLSGAGNPYTNPITDGNQFFRLSK